MKTLVTRLPLLLVFAAVLAGCKGIDPKAIQGPVNGITARHDVYVNADGSLEDIDKAFQLGQAELLRGRVATAIGNKKNIKPGDIKAPVAGVTGRHDAYVTDDEGLSDLERRIYLRDTKLLNELVNEAR